MKLEILHPLKDLALLIICCVLSGEIENTDLLQGTSGGSARTDSYSNRMLSDRARRRRKVLREKADISSAGTCLSRQLWWIH